MRVSEEKSVAETNSGVSKNEKAGGLMDGRGDWERENRKEKAVDWRDISL
jgi:hypothetical protein